MSVILDLETSNGSDPVEQPGIHQLKLVADRESAEAD